MAFTQKQITVSFNYQSVGGGQKTLTGLRCSCVVVNAGGDTTGQMELAIWGMPLSDMNALSILGTQSGTYGSNTVTVTAGEAGIGAALPVVFTGTIQRAVVDARQQPQVVFRVSAYAVKLSDIKPAQPTSVQGSADVAQIAGQLAQQMGLTLEDGGVQAKLSNCYLHGTLLTQMRQLAQHAGISWTADVQAGTLAIVPRNQARTTGGLSVSPRNGLVGYPSFTSSGIALTLAFDPTIKVLSSINVQSDLTPACGSWKIYKVEHEIESQVPRGKWFSYVEANRIGGQDIANE